MREALVDQKPLGFRLSILMRQIKWSYIYKKWLCDSFEVAQ